MRIYGSGNAGNDVYHVTIWAANFCPGERDDSLLLAYVLVVWEAIGTCKTSRQSDRLARE